MRKEVSSARGCGSKSIAHGGVLRSGRNPGIVVTQTMQVRVADDRCNSTFADVPSRVRVSVARCRGLRWLGWIGFPGFRSSIPRSGVDSLHPRLYSGRPLSRALKCGDFALVQSAERPEELVLSPVGTKCL